MMQLKAIRIGSLPKILRISFFKHELLKLPGTNTVNTASTPVSTDSPLNVFGTGGSDLNNTDQDDLQIPALEDIYDNPSDGMIHSIHPTTQILGDLKSAVQTRSKVHKSSRAYAFVDAMQEEFAIQDSKGMDSCRFALWEEGHRQEEGIDYDEDKYVAEILKKFDFASVKTASTPIETQKSLTKDEEAVYVDVHLYRSMISSLIYLTASRPDIMFAVYACSRFQVTSKTSHLNAVKRIFRGRQDDLRATYGAELVSVAILVISTRPNLVMPLVDSSCSSTVSPTIYISYIEQFWNTASSQTVNDEKQIHATVDSKAVVVTEASIRKNREHDHSSFIDSTSIHLVDPRSRATRL
ncbi:hypothetical protein Tco_0419164 [Tanacetum coccineum]